MLYKWSNKNSYKSYCLLFPLQNQTEGHSEHKIELHLEFLNQENPKPCIQSWQLMSLIVHS